MKYFDVQPTIAERLEHVATAISNIDLVMRLAVEGLLEVISEASRHIPAEAKSRAPRIHWRADLGNRLRHAYHETDAGLLWAMIESDLEPLNKFIEQIVRRSDH